MQKVEPSEHNWVKKNGVMACLTKFDQKLKREIKITSQGVFWLGNDHTHYLVIWKGKT